MPKYSIIIPVYNVEKYIERTLTSVFNQTEQDFEVIVVDDGSTDKSIEIAKRFDINLVTSEHVSVSEARNKGVKQAKGKYLLFLDSDDFWEDKLLENISKELKSNPDIVRFQVQTINDDNEVKKYEELPFDILSGEEAFSKIVKYHFIENCWCYAYSRKYYQSENFQFKKDTIHEDFGLIPLTIIKAKKVISIPYIGYNYYRRSGSIMTTTDYTWTQKKVKDFFTHYKYLKKEINKTKLKKDTFKSFIANSMILKICELNSKDYKVYKKLIKKENIYDDLLIDTPQRKIKKVVLKISPKLYYRLLGSR